MTITTTLVDADGGIDVIAVHDGLPRAGAAERSWRTELSHSVQTEFVENRSRLLDPGIADTVLLASRIQSEVRARFITDPVGMLARYSSRGWLVPIRAKGPTRGRDP